MVVAMLEIKDLTVSYGSIAALHGISLRVEKGSIVTLVGGNGAGKTTTLRTISGLVAAKSGSILYEGRDPERWLTLDGAIVCFVGPLVVLASLLALSLKVLLNESWGNRDGLGRSHPIRHPELYWLGSIQSHTAFLTPQRSVQTRRAMTGAYQP